MQSVDYYNLIPELKTWLDGMSIDIDVWLNNVGSFKLAVAFGWLFWPEFIIHDDCVFYKKNFSKDGYQSFMKATEGNKQSVEAVMNHLHIYDLFPVSKDHPSDDLIRHFGQLLKEMWSCKLARDFQDRQFVVRFWEGENNDLDDPQIFFFQERTEKTSDK